MKKCWEEKRSLKIVVDYYYEIADAHCKISPADDANSHLNKTSWYLKQNLKSKNYKVILESVQLTFDQAYLQVQFVQFRPFP